MTTNHKPIAAQPEETKVNLTQSASGQSPDSSALLPHERDQSSDKHANAPIPPEMSQAHKDLKGGLIDTDARAADGRPLGSRRRTQ